MTSDPSSVPLNPAPEVAREISHVSKIRGAGPKPGPDGWNLTYSGGVLWVLRVGSSNPSVPNGFSDMMDGGHII